MSASSRFCCIEMLGALRVVLPDRTFDRFRTQKTGLLLAYLAHHANRSHSREHLIALLWPDADIDAGRDSLTTAPTSLRRQLEPTGVVAGSVLVADRQKVRLNVEAFTTDVAEFESLLATALSSRGGQEALERARLLQQAVALYQGEFLSGYYEDWVLLERIRLSGRYGEALLALGSVLEQAGDLQEALTTARQALLVDPYGEEACHLVMRLQACVGQATGALETYRQLETRFREELNAAPGRALRDLAERIRRDPEAFQSASVPTAAPQGPPQPPPASASPAPTSLPPASPPPVSLPLQTTGFFGREREMQQLAALLRPHTALGAYAPKRRLVTLTGPGGVGKTRLAIEAARELTTSFAGRVWFVSLADVPHPRLMPFTLAHALQVRSAPNIDLLDQIVDKLNAAPCLLLMDNYEHLLQDQFVSKGENPNAADASVLARLLLERVPQASLLVTSRRVLNLGGEQEYPLDALSIPEGAHSPKALKDVESVALYLDRAQYVMPDFALTVRNAETVAQLCRKLEGMPLALEMAAAWVKTLSPGQMLERLELCLDVLVSRRRDLPARQRSLRATIEWSYDLLSSELREMFAQLSVFRGGWTVEAAADVCGLSISECLEGLSELQQHSLVIYDEPGEEGGRYRLLETLRQFGWEKLAEAAALDSTRRRHLTFFLSLAEERAPKLIGPEQHVWMERLEDDRDNYRAALHWCNEAADHVEEGLRLANALFQFWHKRSYLVEGYTHFIAALRLNAAGITGAWAEALNSAGTLASMRGDYAAAKPHYEKSVTIYQELKEQQKMAAPLINLGIIARYQGDYAKARDYQEKGLAIFREQGNLRGVGSALHDLGNTVYDQGELALSHDYLIESLTVLRGVGENWGIALSLMRLGNVAYVLRDLAAAQTYFAESLTMFREIGDRKGIPCSLQGLGMIACQQGDIDTARNYYREGLSIRWEIGEMPGIASSLESFALLAIDANAISPSTETTGAVHAARLWAAAQTLREQIGAPLAPIDQRGRERGVAIGRERLGEANWAAAWDEGRRMALDQAINHALDF